MIIKSMHVTKSGQELENIDLVSDRIIIFGIKQAEGITFDGTFVLKEQLTIIDENDNEISTKQWESLVGQDITYKGETLQMLGQDHPDLEESIKALLQNSIKNENLMKQGGVN